MFTNPIRTGLTLGALAAILGTGVGCAVQPVVRPIVAEITDPAPTPTLPVCTTDYGYMVDGVLTVTVLHNIAEFPCDLNAGMQLNLVWNAETEGEGWGGDASVAAAEQDALDSGCKPRWYNDGDYRLVGENCDF